MTDMRNDYVGNHPLLCLALSLIPLSLSLYGILTGTAVFKSSRWNHGEEPIGFWFTIAFECGLFGWLFSLFILGMTRRISN
jgi:hypothetical protein